MFRVPKPILLPVELGESDSPQSCRQSRGQYLLPSPPRPLLPPSPAADDLDFFLLNIHWEKNPFLLGFSPREVGGAPSMA